MNQNLSKDKAKRRTNSLGLKKTKNKFYQIEEIKRRNHSSDRINAQLLQIENSILDKFEDIYIPIIKKVYPFIFNPDNKNCKKYCQKDYEIISFFCLTCLSHFCIKCQPEHISHTFYDIKKIKIKENEVEQAEIAVKEKKSILFENDLNEELKTSINEAKDEILKFQSYIIDKYKIDKNNFYNICNFLYVFRFKELLKSDENDLLKQFFTLHIFQESIKRLKIFYEQKRLRWLLKNLISYLKDNQIELKKTTERRKKYKFENLDTLLENEGLNSGISTMRKIIKEVKTRNDLKEKIFNFIIRAIDLYKKDSKSFLDNLEGILEQIKIDFKGMIKEEIGNNQELEKFMNSDNFSYYKNNNTKNKIINYIDNKELDSYNFFYVNEYKSKIIELDISNTFIANNHNNRYEKLYSKDSDNKKFDILKLLHNIDKKIEKNCIIYSIYIHSTNIIIANNENNTYIKIYNCSRPNVVKNISKFGEDKVNSAIENENYIIVNNKNSCLTDSIKYTSYGAPDNYKFRYSRKIRANTGENLGIKEQSIELGNKNIEVIIEKGVYKDMNDPVVFLPLNFNSFNYVGQYQPKNDPLPKKKEEPPKEMVRYSFTLTNKHRHQIYIVLMYQNNDKEWMVKGWYLLKNGESTTQKFPDINNRTFYYRGICYECDTHWGKGDATGYIPEPPYPAFTHYDSDEIGYEEDFTKIDVSKGNYSTNLVD